MYVPWKNFFVPEKEIFLVNYFWNFMKWGLKGGISIDADSGPFRYLCTLMLRWSSLLFRLAVAILWRGTVYLGILACPGVNCSGLDWNFPISTLSLLLLSRSFNQTPHLTAEAKVRKSQKQFFLAWITPKKQRNYFNNIKILFFILFDPFQRLGQKLGKHFLWQ